MHSYLISLLEKQLIGHGVSAEQMLAGSGLAPEQLSEPLTLGGAQLDTICANAMAFSGDPQIGLKWGLQINIVSQGIFGYALLSSATVEEALKLLVRYNRAILPSINIKLVPRGDTLELLVQAAHLPRELERIYTELLYAGVISTGRLLIGATRIPPTLELDYEPAGGRDLYEQAFGPATRFAGERRALVFDSKALAVTISNSNPVTQDIFRRECDRILAIDDHRGSVSERVQQAFLQAGSEFPNSKAVAQKLNMSESTLQRKLAKEGCRFQQLLDQVRYRLAREYLTGTTLPVADIALLLGFSDTANFRRSFKRWSSTTPSQLRTAITD